MMKRRELLKLAAAMPLAAACGRLYALPNAQSKLLVVFLRGGYDAANLLVPVSSQFYYDARPGIAIAKPGSDPNTAIALDANWGLHPALRDTIAPLYAKGQVAFIPFCGTNDLTRSHFETQDSVELGQPVDGSRDYQSGFLNRLLIELNGAQPIAFTDQLPIVLRGDRDVPNMALRSLSKPGVDARQSALISGMYQHTSLRTQVDDGFGVRDQVMQAMAEEMDAASRNAITTKGFELEAQRIGKLMAERFDVGFVDVGGWDTHVAQGAATGYLAGRFAELGRGLAAIAAAMGPRWRDTVVVVVSEFGRTFRENGNHGTDHGHGSVYWVLGGSVRGGRVAGEQVALTQPALFQNRDYPILNEYRAVLAGMFARTYGLNSARLDRIFPGAGQKDIGLV
jgi:uncharacterized protein (DUF1501 family)